MYIISIKLVTIITGSNLLTGETVYMQELLKELIGLTPLITIIGCLFVLPFIFFKKYNKKRFNSISILLFIGSILIFTVIISLFLEIGGGNLFGKGYLDVNVIGKLSVLILLDIKKNSIEKIKNNIDDNVNGKRNIQHPLFGISIRKWIKLVEKNGGIDKKYLNRGIFITIFSICTTPFRLIFKIKYSSKIKDTEIKNPPVFIIGHWRSGTTYMHEILCEDSQFCYITLWQTMLPDSFLILEPMKKFLSKFLPKERPMDQIKVDIDGPYEEEAALATLNLWSFFHALHFPKNAEEQYQKSINFEDLTNEERAEWKNNYLNFMKSITFTNKGKRLLLKDPANTARIPFLLELFPDAKFIHIYRNPYNVYLSTVKMRNRVLNKLALQEGNREEIERNVIKNYKELMTCFFKQKNLIPKENFVEIRYEDLIKDPLEEVKKIYMKLKLNGIERALPGMNKYLISKKDYKTNVYNINEKVIERVNKNWEFTIKRWRYKPPE